MCTWKLPSPGVYPDGSKVKVGTDKIGWIVIDIVYKQRPVYCLSMILLGISLTNASRRTSRCSIDAIVTCPITA
jgi:myo-inositol catabolism protein IolC